MSHRAAPRFPHVLTRFLCLTALTLLVAACSEKPKPSPAVAPATGSGVAAPVTPTGTQTPASPPRVSTMAAFYHFDEEAGATTAAEVAGKAPGRLNGGTVAGSPGFLGHALYFARASAGQVVVSQPLDLHTNTVTVLAWIRRRGDQQPETALVYARGSDSVAGLLVRPSGELAYAWGREGRTESWKSGLILPDGVWAFTALVVEPNRATVYLGDPTSSLKAATNEIPHLPAGFDGTLTVGRDPILGGAFEGGLDELGIWKSALTRVEIEKLFTATRDLAAKQSGGAPGATKPAAVSGGKWEDAEFTRAVALMNDAQHAYKQFVQTRANPPVLKKIEDNLHGCVATFEKCKSRAPAGVDVQSYIDRCNKLIFDVHATKTISM